MNESTEINAAPETVRAPRVTPETVAFVLDRAAALVVRRGHEIDAWGVVGPVCVEAAVWSVATGHPHGTVAGYVGERQRALGAAVLVELDLAAEYSSVEAWELADRPSLDDVVALLRFTAQHVREVADQRASDRRERDALRRDRLGAAA